MVSEMGSFTTSLLTTIFNADTSIAVMLLGLFGAGVALVAKEILVASSLSISETGAMFAEASDLMTALRFIVQHLLTGWICHLAFQR